MKPVIRRLALQSASLLSTSLLSAALLAACAAPASRSTLLTLPPRGDTAPAAPLDPGRVLQLGRLTVPEYLTARSVRYRSDPSTLTAWPATVWAERLEVALTRDLGTALHQRLPGWQVCVDHCPVPPSHRVQVDLPVLEHLRSSHTLQAQAHWSWQAGHDSPAVTGQRAATLGPLADSPQAAAVAMAAWNDQLAEAIARQLQPQPAPTATQP